MNSVKLSYPLPEYVRINKRDPYLQLLMRILCEASVKTCNLLLRCNSSIDVLPNSWSTDWAWPVSAGKVVLNDDNMSGKYPENPFGAVLVELGNGPIREVTVEIILRDFPSSLFTNPELAEPIKDRLLERAELEFAASTRAAGFFPGKNGSMVKAIEDFGSAIGMSGLLATSSPAPVDQATYLSGMLKNNEGTKRGMKYIRPSNRMVDVVSFGMENLERAVLMVWENAFGQNIDDVEPYYVIKYLDQNDFTLNYGPKFSKNAQYNAPVLLISGGWSTIVGAVSCEVRGPSALAKWIKWWIGEQLIDTWWVNKGEEISPDNRWWRVMSPPHDLGKGHIMSIHPVEPQYPIAEW
jgi:hypothetical protein